MAGVGTAGRGSAARWRRSDGVGCLECVHPNPESAEREGRAPGAAYVGSRTTAHAPHTPSGQHQLVGMKGRGGLLSLSGAARRGSAVRWRRSDVGARPSRAEHVLAARLSRAGAARATEHGVCALSKFQPKAQHGPHFQGPSVEFLLAARPGKAGATCSRPASNLQESRARRREVAQAQNGPPRVAPSESQPPPRARRGGVPPRVFRGRPRAPRPSRGAAGPPRNSQLLRGPAIPPLCAPRSLLDAPRSPLAQIIEFRVHFTHSTTGDPLLSSFPRWRHSVGPFCRALNTVFVVALAPFSKSLELAPT